MTGGQNSLNLIFGFWQDHADGLLTVSRQAIALIGGGVFWGEQQGMLGHQARQGVHNLSLAKRFGALVSA
jgi:hypothetical protein